MCYREEEKYLKKEKITLQVKERTLQFIDLETLRILGHTGFNYIFNFTLLPSQYCCQIEIYGRVLE